MAVLAPIPSVSVNTATSVKTGCLISIRSACRNSVMKSSFVTKGGERVYPRGALGRNVAGHKRNQDQDTGCQCNAYRVIGQDAVKLRADEPGERQPDGDADDHSGGGTDRDFPPQ